MACGTISLGEKGRDNRRRTLLCDECEKSVARVPSRSCRTSVAAVITELSSHAVEWMGCDDSFVSDPTDIHCQVIDKFVN